MEFLLARRCLYVRSCSKIQRAWLRGLGTFIRVIYRDGGSVGTVFRISLNGALQRRSDKVRLCVNTAHPPSRYLLLYLRWTSLWYLWNDCLLEWIIPWTRVQFEEFKRIWAVGGTHRHLRTTKFQYHVQNSSHGFILWARWIRSSYSYHALIF